MIFSALFKSGQKYRIFCPLFFIFILLAVFSSVAAGAKSSSYYLLLEDEAGKTLLSVPMREGEEFAITWTHSVALTPVTDIFKVKHGEIWLSSTVYQDFGAGLPHDIEPGQTMTHSGGVLTINGYEKRLPVFQVRVGRLAGHALQLFGPKKAQASEPLQEVLLDSLVKPGNAITFSIASQNPD